MNESYFWILLKRVIYEFHCVIIGRGWPIGSLATLCCDYFQHLKLWFIETGDWGGKCSSSRLTVACSQSFRICLDRILWGSTWRSRRGGAPGTRWAGSRWSAGAPPACRPETGYNHINRSIHHVLRDMCSSHLDLGLSASRSEGGHHTWGHSWDRAGASPPDQNYNSTIWA